MISFYASFFFSSNTCGVLLFILLSILTYCRCFMKQIVIDRVTIPRRLNLDSLSLSLALNNFHFIKSGWMTCFCIGLCRTYDKHRDYANRVYASDEVREKAEKLMSGLDSEYPTFIKSMLQSIHFLFCSICILIHSSLYLFNSPFL